MAKTTRYTIPLKSTPISFVLTSYADRTVTTTDGRAKTRQDMAKVLRRARHKGYEIRREVLVCSVCSDPAARGTCSCGRNLCARYGCNAICMARKGHQ